MITKDQLEARERGTGGTVVRLRTPHPVWGDTVVVKDLMETGANDVIVVEGDRERLIPYIWQRVVRDVDLDGGLMIVDWDPDF